MTQEDVYIGRASLQEIEGIARKYELNDPIQHRTFLALAIRRNEVLAGDITFSYEQDESTQATEAFARQVAQYLGQSTAGEPQVEEGITAELATLATIIKDQESKILSLDEIAQRIKDGKKLMYAGRQVIYRIDAKRVDEDDQRDRELYRRAAEALVTT